MMRCLLTQMAAVMCWYWRCVRRWDPPFRVTSCHRYKLWSGGVKGIISCVAAEAAMLLATCYLLPLITVCWLVLVGVSTSLTRLSLVLSHTAQRSLNPGEKNEASFTTDLFASAASTVGLGCLRRRDRRSALRIKIIPGGIHHQRGLWQSLNMWNGATSVRFVSRQLQQIAIIPNRKC